MAIYCPCEGDVDWTACIANQRVVDSSVRSRYVELSLDEVKSNIARVINRLRHTPKVLRCAHGELVPGTA